MAHIIIPLSFSSTVEFLHEKFHSIGVDSLGLSLPRVQRRILHIVKLTVARGCHKLWADESRKIFLRLLICNYLWADPTTYYRSKKKQEII